MGHPWGLRVRRDLLIRIEPADARWRWFENDGDCGYSNGIIIDGPPAKYS